MQYKAIVLILGLLVLVGCLEQPTQLAAVKEVPTDVNVGLDKNREGTPLVETVSMTGQWVSAAPMPTPRSELAAVAVGHEIFVAGGFTADGKPSAAFEIYDTLTDTWRKGLNLPIPLHHSAMGVSYEGKVYVMGGFTGTFNDFSDRTFEFDSVAGVWTEKARMLTGRGALTAQETSGMIYAMGGVDRAGVSAKNEAFNPQTNTWEKKADLPTAREHLASANVGNLLYVMGGRTAFGNNLSTLEYYNFARDFWFLGPNMLTARGGVAGTGWNGKAYVLGGEAAIGTFNNNEAFNVADQNWEVLAPMPTPRHGLAVAAVNGKIYAIGGGQTPGLSVSGLNEVYIPV